MKALGTALSAALLLAAGAAEASATIVIHNADPPGQGFNDTTPVAPVGNNPGTTLGDQRLAVFHEAARIWGDALDSPIPISVFARFVPLSCSSSGSVLGSAAPTTFLASDPPLDGGVPAPTDAGFPNSVYPKQSTWYVQEMVERFAGVQLSSDTGSNPNEFDIVANFNSTLDTDPASCGGFQWYYGLDAQHGAKEDLLTVVLHEFGHGLGFFSLTDPTTGQYVPGPGGTPIPDIWAYYVFDETMGKHWVEEDVASRLASVTSNALAWDGPSVKAAVPTTLIAAPLVRVTSAPATPSAVKDYTRAAPATFGGAITTTPLSGELGLASTGWACNLFGKLDPLDGKIAIVDRGGPTPDAGCTFVEKARNAQDAGAIAVIFANNGGVFLNPGASAPAPDITIPALMLDTGDGQTLKTAVNAGVVSAQMLRDPVAGFAGAGADARAFLYSPAILAPSSSVAHWDTSAFPNLLMEPAINPDLTHSLDLTVPLFRDIGWFSVDLSISGSGPSTIANGQQGTFTFTVTNPGPSTANAVTVSNALSGLTFVSNAGDCTTAFPCALGDIPAGASRTVTTILKAGSGDGTTTATVASTSNYNPFNDTVALTVHSSGGGGTSSGCNTASGPATPWLALLGLLGFARTRRRT
jgi:uncharacterized repeat protein (TIGR01451 family)/MYXO-CTERM domain-containing protein